MVGLDQMLGFDAIRLFPIARRRLRLFRSHRRTSRRWRTSAGGWTVYHWPSSWPLPAKLLSVTQIRERLHDRFRLLAGAGGRRSPGKYP
jgi:hypothetical protein